MFNKLYEWIGMGIASLRNGAAADDLPEEVPQDGPIRRKRPISCVEDGEDAIQEEATTVKKFRMSDWIDTVKIAARGVQTQSSSMASWVKSSVGPSLSNILPASPGPPPPPPPEPSHCPATPSWAQTEVQVRSSGSLREAFIVPSSAPIWKICKSANHQQPFLDFTNYCGRSDSYVTKTLLPLSNCLDALRTDRPGPSPCTALPQRDAPKTNGHSAPLPPALTPRLGRTLNLTPRRSPSSAASSGGSAGSSYTSMYEKTFPIRVVQSPAHCGSPRSWRRRAHCTAQESVRVEEKEVYRQLLAMVSEGQSAMFQDGRCAGLRSHRDLTSFLSSSRRLLQTGPPSAPPSPGPDTPLSSPTPAATPPPEPSPSPAQQGDSSHSALSSVADGDSVIFVKEQQGNPQDASGVPCFHAELWIKELTSLYDSRARERRRLIEEQEAITARLLKQRLSEEGQVGQGSVELRVRVPLEKEVPLAPVVEETKAIAEEPEFPELTEAMQGQVSQALKGGSQDEVLSEGFRLTITRKDIQTLSNLNWLNDEVINFYMNLLVERSRRPGLPSVHTFNTFFYPKLRSAGYPAVRRWTKKVDVFASDILLVPVHLGVHWCLSVVDMRKKSVTYFDSMGGSNDEACRILLKYLEQESQDKKGKVLDTSDWVLQSKKRNEIPQQMNGSDCGMFTCKYAEYITKDRPITFAQKHMPYFRRRMVWEILNQKLL